MSGLILQKGRKYFLPSHTWLKITSLFSDTKNLKYMTQVQLLFEVGIIFSRILIPEKASDDETEVDQATS